MTLTDFAEQWTQLHSRFPQLLDLLASIIAAICILFFGLILARWARRKFRNSSFGKSSIDATLRPVIASLIFYCVLAFTLYAVLTKIGVPAHALLAVFGSKRYARQYCLRRDAPCATSLASRRIY